MQDLYQLLMLRSLFMLNISHSLEKILAFEFNDANIPEKTHTTYFPIWSKPERKSRLQSISIVYQNLDNLRKSVDYSTYTSVRKEIFILPS